MSSAYNKRRERLLEKLHARQPPTEKKTLAVEEVDPKLSRMPADLPNIVGDVLRLKYSDGKAPYPTHKLAAIDILWLKTPSLPELNAGDSVPSGFPISEWGRVRFHIDKGRMYGKFDVDFLTPEFLPIDWSEPPDNSTGMALIDTTHRKIAMAHIVSKHELQGAGSGHSRSNFYSAVTGAMHGWIDIQTFASSAELFSKIGRTMLVKKSGEDTLTKPMNIGPTNLGDFEPLAQCAIFKQLANTCVYTVPNGNTTDLKAPV